MLGRLGGQSRPCIDSISIEAQNGRVGGSLAGYVRRRQGSGLRFNVQVFDIGRFDRKRRDLGSITQPCHCQSKSQSQCEVKNAMQANTILQVKPLSFGNPLDKPADLRVMRLNQGDRDDRPDEFGGHCGGERPAIQGIDGQSKIVISGISVH